MGTEKQKLIILSAGGTGGHVMPAQALAYELTARGFAVEIVTDERGLKYKDGFCGLPIHVLKSGTLGAGVMGKIRGVLNLGLGILQAQKLIRTKQPALVVGFGGYPAFPAVYAAQGAKVPTILHEQNAIIGKANHMLAAKAMRIASSVPALQGIDAEIKSRTIHTGNPIREDIVALYDKPYPALEDNGALNILVMGGSLGASVFGTVLPEAFASLPANHRARLNITQQCRVNDIEHVKAAYEAANIKAEVATFFDDVASRLEGTHLFIGRSGASTVAEMTVAGRPSIFVPYPHHKDQQQKMNANVVADAGGAWVMAESGFTAETVMARIETFLQNPATLSKAAECAKNCAKPDAAYQLRRLVETLLN